jgi:hypothetical protein
MLNLYAFNKEYLISWCFTISFALIFMFYLQGDHSGLYVADQFYYFDMISASFDALAKDLSPRYFMFIFVLKIFSSILGDEYLIYFFYVLMNGIILMLLCRNFQKSHIFFFSISYIYLSHGLLRDQFILALTPLLCRSRFFIAEAILISLRIQLVLLINFSNRFLNLLIPIIFLILACWFRDTLPTFDVLFGVLKSFATLAGVGFLTIDQDFPLIFVLLRICLGIYLLGLMFFLVVQKKIQSILLYKVILLVLCYTMLNISMDIRVYITVIAFAISYFEKVN